MKISWESRTLLSRRVLAAGCLFFIFLFFQACKSKMEVSKVQSFMLTDHWQFRQKGDEKWLPAIVPGCVHSDLMANKLIPDPYYRDNETKVQWVERKEWEYEATFSVPPGMLKRENIRLVFHGIDTYAKVFLNGKQILTTDNMFRKYEVDIKPLLKEKSKEKGKEDEEANLLHIHFLSPVAESKKVWDQLGHELPGGQKVMARKPGYHFGWDWGPRLVTSGLFRPVEVQAWDRARIRELQLVQESVSKERAVMTAHFNVLANALGEATLAIAIAGQKENSSLNHSRVMLQPGLNKISFTFEIKNPRLWWSNGLGKAHLYNLVASLQMGNTFLDRVEQRVGLRTLDVVVKKEKLKDGTPAETFYFKLNGIPVFMKGANYIPQDSFVSRVKSDHYKKLIASAKEANMNMLRVWGGGFYENDIFYDLCDEAGILVWQDFMFACAMYPGRDDFLESVKLEAIDNVKRLRHHPSIALWCGNNEIAEAWQHWGWQPKFDPVRRARITQDYNNIFHGILPAVVSQYDSDRFYWPSSPSFGRGDKRSLYEGDSHYWGVWHDAEPFSMYKERVGRFMSEYGFQSFPSLETVKKFTEPQDRKYDSDVMRVHQKHPRGNRLIETYMKRHFPKPLGFAQFVYFSQLLQAEGMKTAVEAHRRAMPYCMGTLYWQLNDCWPVVSWSGIDYYGQWKALHYYMKRAFAPLLIVVNEEDKEIKINLVSDKLENIDGELSLRLMDLEGKVLWQHHQAVTAKANSSVLVFEQKVNGYTRNNAVLRVEFKQKSTGHQGKSTLLSANSFYFVPPKKLKLKDPAMQVQCSWVPDQGVTKITLSSSAVARGVYLALEEGRGFFSENFFDLFPGSPVTVEYRSDKEITGFKDKLKVFSLFHLPE